MIKFIKLYITKLMSSLVQHAYMKGHSRGIKKDFDITLNSFKQ